MSQEIVDAEVVDGPTTAAVGDLVPAARSALVVPAAERTEIVSAFRAYTELKNQLLSRDDYQSVSGKSFVKKSGWRKLACAFGVTVETVADDETFDDHGLIIRSKVRVRAIAPNGRSMDGVGVCHRNERKFSKPEHDIPATAFTRAVNRACSDLFGFGEVSAEELSDQGNAPDVPWADQVDVDRAKKLAAQVKNDRGLTDGQRDWIKTHHSWPWTNESCNLIAEFVEANRADPAPARSDVLMVEDRTKKRIFAMCAERGISDSERKVLIKETTEGRSDSSNDLTQEEALSLIEYLKTLPKKDAQ